MLNVIGKLKSICTNCMKLENDVIFNEFVIIVKESQGSSLCNKWNGELFMNFSRSCLTLAGNNFIKTNSHARKNDD
jgi:hypothetical protein